jgi:hypothetical protein
MKVIISGKTYDTDKARCVGERGTLKGYEEMYCKRTGEYFILRAGTEIEPLTYEQASEWAKASGDYEREFGEPTEAGDKMLSVRVPAKTYDAIKRASQRDGRTMRDTIVSMAESLHG